jgi:hypothetical protein
MLLGCKSGSDTVNPSTRLRSADDVVSTATSVAVVDVVVVDVVVVGVVSAVRGTVVGGVVLAVVGIESLFGGLDDSPSPLEPVPAVRGASSGRAIEIFPSSSAERIEATTTSPTVIAASGPRTISRRSIPVDRNACARVAALPIRCHPKHGM